MAYWNKLKANVLNIRQSMILLLVILTTIILSALSAFNYMQSRSRHLNELKTFSSLSIRRIAENLELPIFDFDTKKINSLLQTEMMEKQIYAIIIRETKKKEVLQGKQRDEKWEITDFNGTVSGDFIFQERDIVHNNISLGRVEIYITPKFMRKELIDALIPNLLAILFANIVLTVSLYWGLNRILVRPIFQMSKGLNHGAREVADAAFQVSGASESLSSRTSEQASALVEASDSLDQLSIKTEQNNDNALNANKQSSETLEIIKKAGGSMQELRDSMSALSEAFASASKIIHDIDGIAFQTNLLALNAAIEAARAGELGAGFAVVADEVKNLAANVSSAAKTTYDLISGMTSQIQKSVENVSTTGDALSQAVSFTENVYQRVAKISDASTEQTEAIRQMNTIISEITKDVQENAAGAQEISAAVNQMSAQAANINHIAEDLLLLVGGKQLQHEPVSDTINNK